MPVSSPLMALSSADALAAGQSNLVRNSPSGAAQGGFAAVLEDQLPADMKKIIGDLNADQLAVLDSAVLADGGKSLPQGLQALLQQLPVEELEEDQISAAGVAIGHWLQWLEESAANASSAASGAAGTQVARSTADPASNPALITTEDLEDAGELLANDKNQRAREGASTEGLNKAQLDGNEPTRQSRNATQQQDFSAALQRAAGPTANDTQALQGAMLGKLAEQLEPPGLRRGAADASNLDGLAPPGTANATGAALTARPVAAPPQAAGVPFGQPSWGEAMIEKVLWMSSQNLRSVEIQLDPAELGPMEIHIQTRGQEHQVQFISQNPSVREALEAQVHRLRDMFTQQGMEQPEVSVADRSAGDQSGQGSGGLAEQADRQLAQGSPSMEGEAEATAQLVPTPMLMPTDRLVDYYA